MSSNIEMLSRVAHGLGDLKDEVVFVGGSVAELYANDPAASDIRPTLDVDCVVELSTRKGYYELEWDLRSRGFRNDTTQGAPICRWIYEDIIVDIMPIDEAVLGFSNIWYKAGVENREEKILPNQMAVFVFPVEYYLASKFEAMLARGGKDLRISHDFEDIIYIFDNCTDIKQQVLTTKDVSLKEYLQRQCLALINNSNIEESIECVLPYGSVGREDFIYKIIKDISLVNVENDD